MESSCLIITVGIIFINIRARLHPIHLDNNWFISGQLASMNASIFLYFKQWNIFENVEII